MNHTRREFLGRSLLGTLGLWMFPQTLKGAGGAEGVDGTSRKGLLFDAGDLTRLRETVVHPRFAPYWRSLTDADLEADRRFLTTELKLNNHVKHMLQARQILERTSFVFALTHDPRQLEIANLAINKLLAYKRWDYFLEGGEETIGLQRAPEATLAMAFARDWLDSDLSGETKEEMERQIAEKGAPACYRTLYGMKYPDRVKGWGFDPESDYAFRFDLRRWPLILNSTNLKVIPIAGLGVAGCLLRGKHALAQRWLDMALQSARAFSVMFGPDGSYEEGVGYWGYTAQHLALFLEVLRRTTGQDERHLINFPGTSQYALQMSMPTAGKTDDCVNFSDAGAMGDISVAAWTAGLFHDGLAQHVATTVGEVRSNYAVIWYDPAVKAALPGPELLDVRFSNDWVVSRSGWKEEDGVMALRSGGPSNHEHADRNSIIFKAFGERLFHDPFHAAYSYTQPHWLLRQTEAHTAVLIGGKGHQYHDGHEGTNSSWAEANVLEYRPGKGYLVVTSEATQAYRLVNKDVKLVTRTAVFLKPDVLLICDRVRLSGTPLPVQLRFQVNNEDSKGTVGAQGKGFEIVRPGAVLRGAAYAGGALLVRTGTLNLPAEYGVHPYAEVESASALDHILLTVCTAQKAGKEQGTLNVRATEKGWNINGSQNGRSINVALVVSSNIPNVVVES
jgi:hypothetical protein